MNLGSGAQEFANAAPGVTTPSGVLQVGPGIDQTNLWFTQSGNNLVIGVAGTTDQITFDNWFVNDASKLDHLVLSNFTPLFDYQIAILSFIQTHYQTVNPGVTPALALGFDKALQTEVNAAWTGGQVYVIAGGTQPTVSAAALGVQSIFDLGPGPHHDIVGSPTSIIVGINGDSLSGSGVFVADGNAVNVSGTPSEVDVTAGSTVSLSGAGVFPVYARSAHISANMSPGGFASINGISNQVTPAGGGLSVQGQGNTIFMGVASTSVIEAGSGNAVTMAFAANQQAVLAGSSSSVTTLSTGNHRTITLLGTGDAATLSGAGDHVSAYGSSATITIHGTGDTIALFGFAATLSASSDTGTMVYVGPNAAATYNGSNAELDLDTGATLTVTGGSGDAINGSASGGSVIRLTGSNDTVNLNGTGNQLVVGAGSTGTAVNLNAQGGLTYGGNGSTLNIGQAATVSASGDSNTFNLVSQNGGATNVSLTSGHNDTFNAGGLDTITLSGGVAGAVVNAASGANVTLLGSGATTNAAANATVYEVGAGNTLNSSGPGFFSASGTGNIFNIGGNAGSNVSALIVADTNGASGSIINALANTAFTYTGAASTLNLGAGSTVADAFSSGSTFNVITGSGLVDVFRGSNNTLNIGGAYGDNSAATIILDPSATGTVINGGGIIYVSGGGAATINSSAHEAVFLQGAGYQINLVGNGTNINFNGAVGVNTIANSGGPSSEGTLIMADGQGPTHIWMDQVGNDLKITEMGKAETIVISDWFSGPSHQLYSMGTPTHGISNTNVAGLVSAMANYEASYASSHGGGAFDPTAAANGTITDVTVVAAVNAVWS